MKSRLGPEFQKIEEMTRHLPTPTSNIQVGIGDDAAVLRSPRESLLFCSDLMIEGVHFKRDWATPQEIAQKALTRALSDIAAMNGKPLYATISLALAADAPENFHVELFKGFARTSSEYQVEVAGGDLSRSPSGTFIDVSIVGEARSFGEDMKPQIYRRAGAKAGDLLIVTGELGGSAAGLHSLEQGLKDDSRWTLLRRMHLLPQARFDALKKLEHAGLVSSMIDISDSLSSEAHHLAHSSKVGFEILEDAIPIHPAAQEYADRFELKALDLALYGGEDHQLLFTADAVLWELLFSNLASSQPETFDSLFSVIGVCTPENSGVILVDKNDILHELTPRGWDHFSKQA